MALEGHQVSSGGGGGWGPRMGLGILPVKLLGPWTWSLEFPTLCSSEREWWWGSWLQVESEGP